MDEKLTYEELEQRIKELERIESEHQNRHRLIQEAMHNGLWEHDFRNGIFQSSDKMFTMFGYSPINGMAGYEFLKNKIHPEDREIFDHEEKKLITGSLDALQLTFRLQAADGSWRYILSRGNCIACDENGVGYHYAGTHTDITERKNAEDALRRSEEKFRLTFHTSPDSINLNSLDDGVYLDINEGFTKIMGYSREDVIGKKSLELAIWKNPEDRARLVDCLKKNGYVENMEAEFIGKDGNIRNGLMSASVMKINDENVIISITRDNTERKKAEKALRESEEKYRSMMDSMDDAAFICSSENRIEYMNPGTAPKN